MTLCSPSIAQRTRPASRRSWSTLNSPQEEPGAGAALQPASGDFRLNVSRGVQQPSPMTVAISASSPFWTILPAAGTVRSNWLNCRRIEATSG